MAGTTRTVLDNWTASAVETAINTKRTAISLPTLEAWCSELPYLPDAEEEWANWLRMVPTPFGLVLLDENVEEERLHTGGEKLRTLILYVIVSVTAESTHALMQARADTEDSTVSGIETGLSASYFTGRNVYPIAEYEGSIYVPFETMRADLYVGLVITRWRVQTERSFGNA